MSSHPQIIRVFEHQTIRVGEQINGVLFERKHFLALIDYLSDKKTPFFSISHHAVQFAQYVGVIQIGSLLIEILPKADRYGTSDVFLWQRFLLELLQEARWLKITYPGAAMIDLEKPTVLNYIVWQYLNEVEALLKKELTRAYFLRREQQKALKGRLLFRQHLQKNLVHWERFYTESQVFEANHLPNQILFKTIVILNRLIVAPGLSKYIEKLRTLFPPCSDPAVVTEETFKRLMRDRRYVAYRQALLLARMILLNYRPGIRGGKYPLLGMLFDMNQLWENYIYRQLDKVNTPGIEVTRQSRRPFWDRRYLQADLVLNTPDARFILDTKWKILQTPNPGMEDLRQMFVYAQFFEATQTVLIFPKAENEQDVGPIDFALDNTKPTVSCRLCFVNPVENGQLNRRLGEDLIQRLI